MLPEIPSGGTLETPSEKSSCVNGVDNVSNYKQEYLEMELNVLDDGDVKELKLQDFTGKFVAILFYESDFAQLIREELFDMTEKIEQFQDANCQVTCLLSSRCVHMLNFVTSFCVLSFDQ